MCEISFKAVHRLPYLIPLYEQVFGGSTDSHKSINWKSLLGINLVFTCRDCTENFFCFQVPFPMRSMFLFEKIWLIVMAILKIIFFICFWLCWVLIATRGLSLSCGEQGLLSSARASHCGGFSCGAWALGQSGFSSFSRYLPLAGSRATGSVVVAHRFSCSVAYRSSWIRELTPVPCMGRQILYHWATREAQLWQFV